MLRFTLLLLDLCPDVFHTWKATLFFLLFYLFGGGRKDIYIKLPIKVELKEGEWENAQVKRKPTPASKRIRGIFDCSVCGRIYSRKDSLQRHVTYECGKDPQFQCPFCPQKCKQFLVLDSVVPPDENDCLMTLLNKLPPVLKQGKAMRKFKKIEEETTIRPGYSCDSQFECRHCGKRYRWKSTMRRHEQVECGGKEPRFRCPICPYRAKQKGNLSVHFRKHHI
ncbi:hypothetical protein FQR65_LT05704 [Abscondita terminalis]|nr:hypothetical protein FQR65_LT05704 [Abscondita terminalis]